MEPYRARSVCLARGGVPHHCDLGGRVRLVVLGFVGHSNVFGRVMGSTTQNLSRLSPCTVLIVK